MGEPSGVEFQRVHQGLLKEIIVRPILPGERWEALMRRHHYLVFPRRVGESRCGRARRREWFALLGWPAAALKYRPRDRFIGWPPLLQYQRLQLIANHCRFLILPHAHLQTYTQRDKAHGRLQTRTRSALRPHQPELAAGRRAKAAGPQWAIENRSHWVQDLA